MGLILSFLIKPAHAQPPPALHPGCQPLLPPKIKKSQNLQRRGPGCPILRRDSGSPAARPAPHGNGRRSQGAGAPSQRADVTAVAARRAAGARRAARLLLARKRRVDPIQGGLVELSSHHRATERGEERTRAGEMAGGLQATRKKAGAMGAWRAVSQARCGRAGCRHADCQPEAGPAVPGAGPDLQ